MHDYPGTIVKVTDGDTVKAVLDVGLDVLRKVNLRFSGINAFEIRTPLGPEARQYVVDWFAAHPDFICYTEKDRSNNDRVEKYGRYLGTFIAGESILNQELVDNGLAVHYAP